MAKTHETLTDQEVLHLVMTSDDDATYTPEDRAVSAAHHAAVMARYREDMKEWDRRAKLKDRKKQGGRRDYWAELLARDGPLRKGLRVIPDDALSHRLKVNRTEVLKRAETRRKARMERQLLRDTPSEDPKPWNRPVKNAADMRAWIKVTGEKIQRDIREVNRRKDELRKMCGYVDTPEKRAEIRARGEALAGVSDKHFRNHGYANRTSFMNSADESADLEDRGLCPIMDDNVFEPSGGDD
ncbi:MAG: hypothetical protein Q8O63_07445 [Hoeflea sp.]|nr:hypothetical protein [Hoeflea sp.]